MLETNPLSLGTRDVERFLGGFHDIDGDHQSAFAGRLKHLTRGGFPPGITGGPGVPAWYDADRLFQMVTVTALWQHGAMPARAISLVLEAWPRLKQDVLHIWMAIDASERWGKPVEGYLSPAFWRVPVEALRHMARKDRPYSPDKEDTIETLTSEQAHAALDSRDYGLRGSAFIKADQLIRDAVTHLGDTVLPRPGDVALFMNSLIPPPRIEV